MFCRRLYRHKQLRQLFLNSYSTSTKLLNKSKLVLGLESSADDTSAAVLKGNEILSNIILKQDHSQTGGIHPLIAQNFHQKRMGTAIQLAMKTAGVKLDELDGIAFTRGPGMYGCLAVSCTSAKALAAVSGVPLIGIHHMQAHAMTVFLTEKNPPKFPFLTLLLSGGHTLLLIAKSESKFSILATTHDESIGMSLDKACRDLEIDWPIGSNGSPGAALEACADFNNLATLKDDSLVPLPSFPIPFRGELKFSYSGLRSALTRQIKLEGPKISPGRKKLLSQKFMNAAFDQVAEKVKLGLIKTKELGIKGLVVSGGVAANQNLRIQLRKTLDSLGHSSMPLYFPPPDLCTDNAVMIANVGISRLNRGRIDSIETMQIAKWSIEDCEKDFEKEEELNN